MSVVLDRRIANTRNGMYLSPIGAAAFDLATERGWLAYSRSQMGHRAEMNLLLARSSYCRKFRLPDVVARASRSRVRISGECAMGFELSPLGEREMDRLFTGARARGSKRDGAGVWVDAEDADFLALSLRDLLEEFATPI